MKTKIPFEYKITILYVIIGSMWILFSDELVFKLFTDEHQLNQISIYKGWLFIIVTGLLLFVLIKREIQKQKKLYHQLFIANRKAMESDRLKTAFLSNLSHYIRTPMNSVLGFAELLKQRNLDEDKRIRFLNYINEKSNSLLYTIDNIIEISKIQEGQVVIKKSIFSINEMIKNLSLLYNIELQKKKTGVTLYYSIDFVDGADRLESDYEKIYHILSNLLRNAINFTEKGEIEFGYKAYSEEIVFYVRDTGKGISSEKLKNLFSSFLDSDANIQQLGEGSGLGLHLSSGLAKLLGGRLWLDYTSEHGSRFCFSLPNPKPQIIF